MGITRKVRRTGESLAVMIPSQVAAMHNIHEGDSVEFMPIRTGELRIKKVG